MISYIEEILLGIGIAVVFVASESAIGLLIATAAAGIYLYMRERNE